MEERRNKIRELEAKKSSDVRARNQVLEGFGETLFQRIGEGEPFDNNAEGTPGKVLAEYRKLQAEIAQSKESIASLEKEHVRLKELEEKILASEEEKSRLEKELPDVYTRIGKALLDDLGPGEFSELAKQQKDNLLARIEEQEKKLEELEKQEVGVIKWLGKNAQITVIKALLSKDRLALRRLYRDAGEKFIADKPVDSLAGDIGEDAKKAFDLKGLLASLTEDLSGLKGERRKIEELFGGRTPSRRINGHEKNIAHIKGKFPPLYLAMGSLAVEKKELLSSFINESDGPVFERVELLGGQISQFEIEIKKIKAAIDIDEEKAEIEKLKKSINNQQQKIAASEEAIDEFEKQIAESEHHVDELNAFIQEDHGSKE